ncbi:hypothetical protein ABIH54_003749 [Enterobacter bugandensis]
MTANKPMTGEQLDELMTVAVNMQRDAETDCNRPSAMFAYAVQVAVLELRKVRNDASALAAENGQMLRLLTDVSENHDEYVNQDDYLYAGIPMDYVSEINMYVSRDVEADNPFKETDAYLAEVRASEMDSLAGVAETMLVKFANQGASEIPEAKGWEMIRRQASQRAAQLRKGVQS